jgi:predicted transcriptional regulator
MPKIITLRLKDEVYQEFSEAARSESRSVSNLIQTSALAKIREQQFADDAEMNEILSDKELMKRIKTGSRDARLRRGQFAVASASSFRIKYQKTEKLFS